MRTCTFLSALFLAILITTLQPSAVHAENIWYYGIVEKVKLVNGGFFVTYTNTELDDCQHRRVYISTATLEQERVDRAFTLALASKLTGVTFGVVIDKDLNGPGGRCDIAPTTTQGAGLI